MINRGAIEQMWKQTQEEERHLERGDCLKNNRKFGSSYVFAFKSYFVVK